MASRIPEIDLLRTLAIILMIIYHTAYDLWAFYSWDIDLFGSFWEAVRILTASLFLLVSGVSVNFSRKPLKRALIVLSCALLISLITFLYDSSTFIYFGILHCIAFGMFILIPLKRLKEWNILIGLLILTLAPTLAPLRPTLDYYPPLPWIGLMLMGAGIGYLLYIRKRFAGLQVCRLQGLAATGRYALLIYLIHQPILLMILHMIYN